MKGLVLFMLTAMSLSSFANYEYINGECWSCSNGGKFVKASFGCVPERKSTPISVSLSYCGVSEQQAQKDLWSPAPATALNNQPVLNNSLNNYNALTQYDSLTTSSSAPVRNLSQKTLLKQKIQDLQKQLNELKTLSNQL